jgi:hypothetical protein
MENLDSKAASAMNEQAKVTNPKARDFPDSLSRIICKINNFQTCLKHTNKSSKTGQV